MAETENMSSQEDLFKVQDQNENMDIAEPKPKKAKTEDQSTGVGYKLEERLNGILCCAVCLDLPLLQVLQVGRHLFYL